MSDETETVEEVEELEPLEEAEWVDETAAEELSDADIMDAEPSAPPVRRAQRTQFEDVSPEDREFIRRVFL
ncbi:MAG: hypothetical protein AAFQ82_22240, partial [Myxococcota bacterium]